MNTLSISIFLSGLLVGVSTNSLFKGIIAANTYVFGMGWAVSMFSTLVSPFIIVALGFVISLLFINNFIKSSTPKII